MNKIPGLKCITEQIVDGKSVLTVEIDDDKSDEFFISFGLKPGDEQGLNEIMAKAIGNYIASKAREVDNER